MKSLEGDFQGSFGRATLAGLALPIIDWGVGPTSTLFTFTYGVTADFPLFNVTLGLRTSRLNATLREILGRPVSRAVRPDGGFTVVPEIIITNVQLFDQEGDEKPDMEFDKVVVINGPVVSADSLVMVCANLTPAKEQVPQASA